MSSGAFPVVSDLLAIFADPTWSYMGILQARGSLAVVVFIGAVIHVVDTVEGLYGQIVSDDQVVKVVVPVKSLAEFPANCAVNDFALLALAA